METGEEVGCYAAVWYCGADIGNAVKIPFACIFAVHILEHAVAARLNREVYPAADVRVRSYGFESVVSHIFGVRCSEAHAHVGRSLGHTGKQFGEACSVAFLIGVIVAVYVLSQQGYFLVALCSQVGDLVENTVYGA